MAQRIHKGDSIAITCGSRGVANIAKIINSNPQVVFISTFGPTQPLIAKQLRQFGYNGLCFTKDLYQVDALNVAGAASNGIAFAYPYLTYSSVDECDDAFIKDFLTAYEAEYGTLPVSDCAYRAYDSMLVLKYSSLPPCVFSAEDTRILTIRRNTAHSVVYPHVIKSEGAQTTWRTRTSCS